MATRGQRKILRVVGTSGRASAAIGNWNTKLRYYPNTNVTTKMTIFCRILGGAGFGQVGTCAPADRAYNRASTVMNLVFAKWEMYQTTEIVIIGDTCWAHHPQTALAIETRRCAIPTLFHCYQKREMYQI